MMRRLSSGVHDHVLAQRKTFKKKKIKNWHKSLFLFCFLLIYLIFGAVVFRAIEEKSQLQVQHDLNTYSYRFLLDHESCLDKEDLREYVKVLLDAIKKGAIPSDEYIAANDSVPHALWDLPNAFFFSSTVVTTIGYGNIFPYTATGRIVCIFYALVGIPMTAWMLSCIGHSFHDKWQSISKLIRKITHRFKSGRINHILHIVVVFLLAYSIIIVVPAIIISYAEDWWYIDAHYFCFISLTTIGFGDLAPMTWKDEKSVFKKWLQTVMYVTYLLLGLSLLSVAFTAFLMKHKGQFKSARKRMTRFVAHSARNATIRMKDVAERGYSPASTPEGSIKHKYARKSPEKNTVKLLTVVARLSQSVDNNQTMPYQAPWKLQNSEESDAVQSSENPTIKIKIGLGLPSHEKQVDNNIKLEVGGIDWEEESDLEQTI